MDALGVDVQVLDVIAEQTRIALRRRMGETAWLTRNGGLNVAPPSREMDDQMS